MLRKWSSIEASMSSLLMLSGLLPLFCRSEIVIANASLGQTEAELNGSSKVDNHTMSNSSNTANDSNSSVSNNNLANSSNNVECFAYHLNTSSILPCVEIKRPEMYLPWVKEWDIFWIEQSRNCKESCLLSQWFNNQCIFFLQFSFLHTRSICRFAPGHRDFGLCNIGEPGGVPIASKLAVCLGPKCPTCGFDELWVKLYFVS